MKRNLITITVLIIIFTNCKHKTEKLNSEAIEYSQTKDLVCFKKNEREKLVFSIFETDALQKYVRPLAKRGLELQVLENDFLTKNLEITVNNLGLKIMDSINLNENAFKVSLGKINCKEKKVLFNIWYEFEHADLEGVAFYCNDKWLIDITSHGIVD